MEFTASTCALASAFLLFCSPKAIKESWLSQPYAQGSKKGQNKNE